jgi:hypothetical protein
VAEMLPFFLDVYTSRKTMIYSTFIDSIEVSLEFETWDGGKTYSVGFRINKYYDMDESISKLSKLKITKWLLINWKQFISNHGFDFIQCYAYDEDGYGEYREKIYKKIGFKDKEENSIVKRYTK